MRLVPDHPVGTLRASRETAVRGVTPLGKDLATPGGARFVGNASRIAAPVTITLKEYE